MTTPRDALATALHADHNYDDDMADRLLDALHAAGWAVARTEHAPTAEALRDALLRRIDESGHCRWCYVVTERDLDAFIAAIRAAR